MLRLLPFICLSIILSASCTLPRSFMDIHNVQQITISEQNKSYVFNRQDEDIFRFTYQEYPQNAPLAIPSLVERLSPQSESTLETSIWTDCKAIMQLEKKPIQAPQIADWSLNENHIAILLHQSETPRVYFRGSLACTQQRFHKIIKKVEIMRLRENNENCPSVIP